MSLVPGAHLGPEEIVAATGAGGTGEVYRARATQLKRDVALKVLPAEVATDPDRLARSQREAELLAALNHPHIAQIHGLGDTEGICVSVVELADGPTLAERIARGPIPLDEAKAGEPTCPASGASTVVGADRGGSGQRSDTLRLVGA